MDEIANRNLEQKMLKQKMRKLMVIEEEA